MECRFWCSTLINSRIVVAIIPPCLLHVTLGVRRSLGSEDLQSSQGTNLIWFVYLRNMYGCTASLFLAYLCFSTRCSEDISSTSKGFPWHFSHWLGCFHAEMLVTGGIASSDPRRIKRLPSLKPTASSPLTTDGLFRWISFWGLGLFSGVMLRSFRECIGG